MLEFVISHGRRTKMKAPTIAELSESQRQDAHKKYQLIEPYRYYCESHQRNTGKAKENHRFIAAGI